MQQHDGWANDSDRLADVAHNFTDVMCVTVFNVAMSKAAQSFGTKSLNSFTVGVQ